MAKTFLISDGYKKEIDEVLSRVGNMAQGSVQRIQTRFESMPGDRTGEAVFRICTFTGAWAVNTQKTVTFKYVTNTPNTVIANNVFVSLNPSSAFTHNCAIAKEGTAWFLIATECV